ncbi:MAG: DUF1707 domain-containing protein [Nocardioidaceae bacterium]|nr:DUF1707 domain-containing protein [Nocardioidaceae bacterium]NUS52642.1 DUF1707 domain-containing protein [Nocardioidaceae bacterium]
MDDAAEPQTGGTDFPVTDHQRQAAVNHLEGEFARGVLDTASLERRRAAVLAATSVAELLAATADEQASATAPSSAVPSRRTNMVALTAGLVVGLLVLVSVLARIV